MGRRFLRHRYFSLLRSRDSLRPRQKRNSVFRPIDHRRIRSPRPQIHRNLMAQSRRRRRGDDHHQSIRPNVGLLGRDAYYGGLFSHDSDLRSYGPSIYWQCFSRSRQLHRHSLLYRCRDSSRAKHHRHPGKRHRCPDYGVGGVWGQSHSHRRGLFHYERPTMADRPEQPQHRKRSFVL